MLVGQKETNPKSHGVRWSSLRGDDARKNNVRPVIDGGVREHPLQVSASRCPPPGTGVPGRATALSVCVLCEKRKRPELNTGPVKGSKEKGIAMSPPAF